MNNNDLQKYKTKLGSLSLNEQKMRDLHLRNLSLGKVQGPPTNYASVDKPWLKYYDETAIKSNIPQKTLYRYSRENAECFLDDIAMDYYGFNITTKKVF